MYHWLNEHRHGRPEHKGVGSLHKRARWALGEDPWGILIINPCPLRHYTWGNSRRIYWKMTNFRELYNSHFALTDGEGLCCKLSLECRCELAAVSIWDTSETRPTRALLTNLCNLLKAAASSHGKGVRHVCVKGNGRGHGSHPMAEPGRSQWGVAPTSVPKSAKIEWHDMNIAQCSSKVVLKGQRVLIAKLNQWVVDTLWFWGGAVTNMGVTCP